MKDVLIIDNWFDKEELENVWKELDFYSCNNVFERAESLKNTSKDPKTKKPLANSSRLDLGDFYKEKHFNVSFILKYLNKIRNEKFHQKIRELGPISSSFLVTNADDTIVNYYDKDEVYETHVDVFHFTILIYLNKEPKLFTGGDLELPELNKTIEYKNNRLIAFPSWYKHKSTQLKSNNVLNGYGKYSITHFFWYQK